MPVIGAIIIGFMAKYGSEKIDWSEEFMGKLRLR
jgi:hypothetical protein